MTAVESSKRERRGPAVPLLAALVLVLVGAYFLRAVTKGPPTTFDDSYMFLRYAKHLLAGHGHAWNPDGVQTYGITSLPYVFVVTALRGLVSPETLSDAALLRMTSAGIGVLAVAVMMLTAWRFSTAGPLRRNLPLWACLLAAPMLCSGVFVYHARTGMDTTLSLLTNSALVYATLRMKERRTVRSLVPVVLAAYLTFATRPDNGLYAFVFPAATALFLLPGGTRVRTSATFCIALASVLALDAAVKYAVFGVPVPLPTYAKSQGYYVEYAGAFRWNAMAYLLEFCALVLPYLCLVVAFVRRSSLALIACFLVPTALTLATYFGMTQIMGYMARFSFPSLPFVAICAVLALDRHVSEEGGLVRLASRSIAPRLVLVFALVALVPVARKTLPGWYARQFLRAEASTASEPATQGSLPAMDYWRGVRSMIGILEQGPQGTVVAASEYGCLGAALPEVTILDPLGLHDAEVALNGFSAEALLAKRPDLIWMPHPDYVSMRAEILQAEELWTEYDVYPSAFLFGVAIRRTGPNASALQGAFRDAWERNYPGAPMQDHRARR